MQIKFVGQSDMMAEGLTLIPGFKYEVSEAVYKYLKDTFGNVEIVDGKVKPEPEVKVEAEPEAPVKKAK